MDTQQQENPYAAPESPGDPFDTSRQPMNSRRSQTVVVLIGMFVTIGVFAAFCFGVFGVLELTGIFSAMGAGFQLIVYVVVIVAGLIFACGCAGWCVERHVSTQFRRRQGLGKSSVRR